MKNTGNKVMRKVKGLWVAAALVGAMGVATPQIVNAQVDEVGVEDIQASKLATQFEGKDEVLEDELVQSEIKDALKSTNTDWVGFTLEQTLEEIERQSEVFNVENDEDFELTHYIIQWGDTLSVLAEAFDVNEGDLAKLNDIEDQNFILAGDILTLEGIDELERDASTPAKDAPTTPVTTDTTPSKPTPEPVKPGTNTPDTENPDTEVPDTDNPDTETPDTETPDTEDPDTENPDTEDPDTEDPDTEDPDTETPDTEDPDTEEPDVELPTDEVIESEHEEGETTTEVIDTEEVVDEDGELPLEDYTDAIDSVSEGETVTVTEEYQDEPTYEVVETEVPVLDEEGNPVLDDEGNPVVEVVTEEVEVPGAWHTSTVNTTVSTYTSSPGVQVIYDNTLDEGVEIVEVEGVEGVRYVTRVQEILDGEVISDTTSEEVVTEIQDRVVRVGTKIKGNIKETVQETQVITQGKKTIIDPNKWEDFSEDIPGKAGSIVRVIEVVTSPEGEELSRTVVSEEVTEAEYDVTVVGTKPIKGQKTVVNKVEIPFEVEVREVDSYNDKETVVQKGVKGIKEVTSIVHTEKGVEVSREVTGEVVTQAPVKQIVERGRANLETKEVQETESFDFNKTIITNPELPEGETKVVREGVKGVKTSTYKVEYKDGVEVSRTLVSEGVTTPPVDEVTEIGSKVKVETRQRTEEQVIKFKTVETGTNDLYVGESRVKQKGVNGVLEIVLEDTIIEGKVTATKEVKRQVKKVAVDQIVEVGTKTKVSSEDQQLNEIRNEFHRLLNEHRNQNGLHSLDYYEQFEDGADLRAYEVREGGGHFSHTRPDGSSQSTAYSDIKDVNGNEFAVGENILYRGWYDNQTTKEVAYDMFNQFKNSPGHYTNMMSEGYTGQSLGLHVKEKEKSHYSWKYVSLAQALIATY